MPPAPPRFLPDPVPKFIKISLPDKSRKFDGLLCPFGDFGAKHEGEYFGSEIGILRELPRCCATRLATASHGYGHQPAKAMATATAGRGRP